MQQFGSLLLYPDSSFKILWWYFHQTHGNLLDLFVVCSWANFITVWFKVPKTTADLSIWQFLYIGIINIRGSQSKIFWGISKTSESVLILLPQVWTININQTLPSGARSCSFGISSLIGEHPRRITLGNSEGKIPVRWGLFSLSFSGGFFPGKFFGVQCWWHFWSWFWLSGDFSVWDCRGFIGFIQPSPTIQGNGPSLGFRWLRPSGSNVLASAIAAGRDGLCGT